MGSCASQALLDLFITGFIRSVPIPAGNVPLFEVKSLACPKVPGTPFVSAGDFAWIKGYLRQPIRKELPILSESFPEFAYGYSACVAGLLIRRRAMDFCLGCYSGER